MSTQNAVRVARMTTVNQVTRALRNAHNWEWEATGGGNSRYAPPTRNQWAEHRRWVAMLERRLRALQARPARAARTIQTAYRAHRARAAANTVLNSLRNSLAAIRAGGQGRNVREIYNNMGNMWHRARNQAAAARIMNNAQLFLNRRGQLALSAHRRRSPSRGRSPGGSPSRSRSRSRSPRQSNINAAAHRVLNAINNTRVPGHNGAGWLVLANNAETDFRIRYGNRAANAALARARAARRR